MLSAASTCPDAETDLHWQRALCDFHLIICTTRRLMYYAGHDCPSRAVAG